MSIRKWGVLGLMAAAMLLALATGAWAEETSWNTDTGVYWHDSANWTNGIPNENKDAVLDNYSSTTLTGTNGIARSVVVGKSATYNNFLYVKDNTALTVKNDVQMGVLSESMGYLSIGSGSSLSVGGNLRVGVGGWSHLDNQGTLQVDGGLYMGEAAGSISSIFFGTGCTGKFSFATIGIDGSEASFNQWGGTVTITGGLTCGVNSGSSGSYSVGQSGHTGQLTVDHVVLGEKADSSGGLGAMGGGTINVTNSLVVGQGGYGSAGVRYEGSNMTAGSIVLAQEARSTGFFSVLEHGSLTTNSLVVGAGGQEAHFLHGQSLDPSMTTVTVNGTLTVGAVPRILIYDPVEGEWKDPYIYGIWLGSLKVQRMMVEHGSFLINDSRAYFEFSETFHLGENAIYNAVPGATIIMTGSNFSVESTNLTFMAGLKNTKMVFLGGEGVTDTFEVGFDLGALEIGPHSHVRLVDLFDNNLSGTLGDEGLWVASLILREGATLDKYGLTLTYDSFSGNPDQIISTPIPGSLLLLGSGLLGLGLLGYRKKRS